MKKLVLFSLVGLFLFGFLGFAAAAQPGTPEYEKMKEYKKAQREKKSVATTSTTAGEKGFWQKEAERSGFAGTAAMFGNAVSGVVPLDKPNSRKNKPDSSQ